MHNAEEYIHDWVLVLLKELYLVDVRIQWLSTSTVNFIAEIGGYVGSYMDASIVYSTKYKSTQILKLFITKIQNRDSTAVIIWYVSIDAL